MKIGIAGVGGIGSNVAVLLVRNGLTQLKLVDFDRVDLSNLNRQYYFSDQVGRLKVEMLATNLTRICPDALLEVEAAKITRANIGNMFSDCDIVVEGFDNQEDKKLLLEHFGESGTAVFSACGIAGYDLDRIRTRTMGIATVVGDFTSDCADLPVLSHKVIAVAAKITELIVRRWRDGA
jgi:sulfur carrier protein ThiS adenylyltransferase